MLALRGRKVACQGVVPFSPEVPALVLQPNFLLLLFNCHMKAVSNCNSPLASRRPPGPPGTAAVCLQGPAAGTSQ